MRDQQRGRVRACERPRHGLTGLGAKRRVERRERLVQQHERGRGRERAGERHTLLLAAGERVRRARHKRWREPDELEELVDA